MSDSVFDLSWRMIDDAYPDGISLSPPLRGYRLANLQKLADTLVDFDSYLVLQRSEGEERERGAPMILEHFNLDER